MNIYNCGLDAFRIENDHLLPVSLFCQDDKWKSSLTTELDWGISIKYAKNKGITSRILIYYDDIAKTIYIPEISNNNLYFQKYTLKDYYFLNKK